jgi:S1-C subfamily serine protease
LVISTEENLPAYIAGIKPGDVITHINGVKVLNSSHFSSLLKK